MGLLIVSVVGSILGWLAAIVLDRDLRGGTAVCAGSGVVGAIAGALLVGGVPLLLGVSAAQLLWSVLGGLFAIVATNAALAQLNGRKT